MKLNKSDRYPDKEFPSTLTVTNLQSIESGSAVSERIAVTALISYLPVIMAVLASKRLPVPTKKCRSL